MQDGQYFLMQVYVQGTHIAFTISPPGMFLIAFGMAEGHRKYLWRKESHPPAHFVYLTDLIDI